MPSRDDLHARHRGGDRTRSARRAPGLDRHVHLVLENDANQVALPRARHERRIRLYATAQWNDDVHHALHVLTTGETDGYYADYAGRAGWRLWAGRSPRASPIRASGPPSAAAPGAASSRRNCRLPPSSPSSRTTTRSAIAPSVTRLALQASEPALHAAAAIILLSPHVPLLFMGEEWGARQPFCFFCDFAGDLAEAVREGRRREFANFAEFRDPAQRARIPDPNAEATFARSVLDWSALARPEHAVWLERYRTLLALRAAEIVPRLAGSTGHAGSWRAIGELVVLVAWSLGDGTTLTLFANFSGEPVIVPENRLTGRLLYATAAGGGALAPPASASVFLTEPAQT